MKMSFSDYLMETENYAILLCKAITRMEIRNLAV